MWIEVVKGRGIAPAISETSNNLERMNPKPDIQTFIEEVAAKLKRSEKQAAPFGPVPMAIVKWLPYPETVTVCDISTREVEHHLTGEEIHAMVGENIIYVSQKMHDDIEVRFQASHLGA